MKAVMITLFILAALFILLSGFIIVCIAWTHRPISVWAMIKEFIAELLSVDYNKVSAYGHFGKSGLPWEG